MLDEHGRIWVESEPGNGAAFSFHAPGMSETHYRAVGSLQPGRLFG
jgi:signal transduction histidine kinase